MPFLEKTSLKALFKTGIAFFYPWMVVTVFCIFLVPETKEYLKEVIAFGLWSLALFLFVFLIPKVRFRKALFLSFWLLLSVLGFIKLSFYYLYETKVSASALFVIFETNATEASSFAMSYVNLFVIFLLLLFILPFFFLCRIVRNKNNRASGLGSGLYSFQGLSILQLVAVFMIPICLFLINTNKLKDKNIILVSFNSHNDYKIAKENLKKNLAKKTSPILEVFESLNEEQTHIVIIGESTSKWHMQLYGYDRDTNPLLSEIDNELLVFKDVITPHVHTITALEKILTLSHFKQVLKDNNASAVQLANEAGFTTYWLSNQKPVGIYDSVASLIGGAADQTFFMSTNNYTFSSYDEDLLPVLDDILKQKEKKKIIFMHLIGTHSGYEHRHPKEKQFFTSKKDGLAVDHELATTITNQYDDAIRYNDSIVRETIEKVRQLNSNSYVMYFSDHGDEVYDTMDFMGHNEYHGTPPMYEVPLIVWLSETYKERNPQVSMLDSITDRKYSLEHFIHSFSDLSRIDFNLFEAKNSIFNPDFQTTTRWIKNNMDYDLKAQ